MAKKNRQRRPKKSPADKAKRSSPGSPVLLWLGWPLLLCGVIGLAASLRTVFWELKTLALYTEGRCQVVSAQAVYGDGTYWLEVKHVVQIPGQTYRSNTNTEQDAPTYNTQEEAQERLTRYAVGSTHPCWYDAANPERYSVLVLDGIHVGRSLAVLAVCLALGAIGSMLVWRGSSKDLASVAPAEDV